MKKKMGEAPIIEEPKAELETPLQASDAEFGESQFAEDLRRIRELEEAHRAKKAKAEDKKEEETRPWADNRWKRDLLRVAKKRADRYYYWVAQRDLQTFLNKGWKFADIKETGGVGDKIIGEETALDTRVRRREMVLMECPRKWREDFEDYRAYKRRSQFARSQEELLEAGFTPKKPPQAS